MPYEVVFRKEIEVITPSIYINSDCYGGDVILARLLPEIKERYESLQMNQKECGWFARFRKGHVDFAINVFCEDPDFGVYLIRLTTRVKRFLWFDRVIDTPELEELRDLVVAKLKKWGVLGVSIKHLDPRQV